MKKLLITLFSFFVISTALACNITATDFDISGGEALHKSTGLVWKRCPLGYKLNDTLSPPRCTFEQVDQFGEPVLSTISFESFNNALNVVNALGNGWRLPNEKEAVSVVDLCTISSFLLLPDVFPQLDDFVFNNFNPNILMLTSNASAIRLYQVKGSIFFTDRVNSASMSTETLLYPVKTADPLPR